MFIGLLYSYCMFIFIGIHANPSYTIHTESLTTSNGLSNNTVRHIYIYIKIVKDLSGSAH